MDIAEVVAAPSLTVRHPVGCSYDHNTKRLQAEDIRTTLQKPVKPPLGPRPTRAQAAQSSGSMKTGQEE